MRYHRLGGPFRPDPILGFAERERLRLGEDVRRQDVVMIAERVDALAEADQVDRDQLGPLVQELVEAALAVGARLAPVGPAFLPKPRKPQCDGSQR